MRYFGMSSRGRVRDNNEDFFHVPQDASDVPLFIAADGMGGENGGEIASALAVSSVAPFVKERYAASHDLSLLLHQAVNEANRTVFQTAQSDAQYAGMGTTLVCALFRDDLAFIANVGDSRCYFFHENELEQVSVDHSYVQEMVNSGILTKDQARSHPQKNLITRAVGSERLVRTDVFCRRMCEGDKLLLATDGLTGMLTEKTIRDILSEETDCEQTVRRLIRAAEDAGGNDNITAILVCR